MVTYKRLTQKQFEERISGHIQELKNQIAKKRNKNSLPRYLLSRPYSYVKGNIEKCLHYLEERGITSQDYSSAFAETINEYREMIESSEKEVYEPTLHKRTKEVFQRISLERRIRYTAKQDEKLRRICRENRENA